MVFSFYTRANATPPLPQMRDKRASSFRGLHVSFYDTGLGLVGDDVMNPTGPGQSTSSWLTWDAPLRHSSQLGSSYNDGRRPRSEEEVERSANSFLSERPPSIRDDAPPSSVDSSATDPITRGISEGFSSPIVQLPASSVYDNGQSSTPTAAAMVISPDSPTLPYGGIREARESNLPSHQTKQPSDGSTFSSQLSGFENLLREQNELERSIAALRAMSVPGQSGEQPRRGSPGSVSDLPERSRLRESSTTGYGPTSSSNKSEFSLSVFPVPPQVRQPQITETPARTGRRSSMASAPTPTRMSYTEEQVLPVSTAEDEVAISAFGRRTESAGTHYDVTSFIGGAAAILLFRDASY
jgi:hypothetical protein